MLMPTENRVLVEPLPAEVRTPMGLVIPETSQRRPTKGKVLAVGPGRRSENGNVIPTEIEVDDIVLYTKYSGADVKVGERECVIMLESDILAVDCKA